MTTPLQAVRGELEAIAASNGQPAVEDADGSSLAQRLADSRVDLLARLDGGIPERAWLPCSQNMLARGARHHVAAPLKSGKSIAFETHGVDMTIAGATVAILDRENGADEYARRLRDVLNDRPDSARDAVRDRLRYYAWPVLKLTDGAELARALAGVDLVVIDSTRTFLSSLALDEDRSDDFAKFAVGLIEPLFRAGIATLQLDNTGHSDDKRARGSSTKGDLADVLYTLRTASAFDEQRPGRVILKRTRSRFGDIGPAFAMSLGNGHFGTFDPDDHQHHADDGPFRPTVLMERVSRYLESVTEPKSQRDIETSVTGSNPHIRDALNILVTDEYVTRQPKGRATLHTSTKPYREADETTHASMRPRCVQNAPKTHAAPHASMRPSPYGEDAQDARADARRRRPVDGGMRPESDSHRAEASS